MRNETETGIGLQLKYLESGHEIIRISYNMPVAICSSPSHHPARNVYNTRLLQLILPVKQNAETNTKVCVASHAVSKL